MRFVRLCALACTALTLAALSLTSGVAQGDSADVCHWRIHWPSAGLYADPGRNLITSLPQNYVVGPYCVGHDQFHFDVWYRKVHTEKDHNDQTGWIREHALVPA